MRKFDNRYYRRGEVIHQELKAILLESKQIYGGFYIVLAVIPRLAQGEYVVWEMLSKKSCVSGDYFFNLQGALDRFEERGLENNVLGGV